MLSDLSLPSTVIDGVRFNRWFGIENSELHLINTLEEWKTFYRLLSSQDLVAFDTETTGFEWFGDCHIIGLSFGWKHRHFYVALRHEESIQGGVPEQQVDIEDIKEDLRTFFAKPTRLLLAHNFKFDGHFIAKEGIAIHCKVHDTRTLWQFYDENAPGALKVISTGWKDLMGIHHKGLVGPDADAKETEIDEWRTQESRLRRDAFRKLVMAEATIRAKDLKYQHLNRSALKKQLAENELANHKYAKSGKEDIHYGYIPVSLMAEYAALDTFLTYKLYEFCVKNIQWNKNVVALYKNEAILTHALFAAEQHGVRINRDHLVQSGKDMDAQMLELTTKIKLTLGDINLRSAAQMTKALQDLGVVFTKYTEASADAEEEDKVFAIDKKVLAKLQGKHEVISDILKLRELAKLKGTYVDGMIDKLDSNNVIHCRFNQNVATGRMSVNSPNLQNIPARDKTIRRAFIPWDDDFIYFFADYSQIEVRLTAHLSQDPLLLDAYAKNQDIHTRTCCEVFGFDIDEVTEVLKDENHPAYAKYSLMRTVTKRINFGIIYGVGAPGLSEQIDRPAEYKGVSDDEWVQVCQGYIDAYLDRYIGVRRFVNTANREVKMNSQVTNEFGRVRNLPHAKAKRLMADRTKGWMEARAQRQGVNFLVQSMAADIFKIAVVRIYALLKGKKSKLVNFVHDEVQIYLHKDEMDLIPLIKHAMEDWHFSIPIIADFSTSTVSWGDKKGYKLP